MGLPLIGKNFPVERNQLLHDECRLDELYASGPLFDREGLFFRNLIIVQLPNSFDYQYSQGKVQVVQSDNRVLCLIRQKMGFYFVIVSVLLR